MKMTTLSDTIAAISTPLSGGAISIIRLSGSDAIKIADKVFRSKNKLPSSFPARVMTLGKFSAKNFNDNCLCVVFKAPNSYSGEDMVEFQSHGGAAIAKGILESLIDAGARLATPGEFTRRAFINGKMSLNSAEGMMDMINAESDAEVRAGYSLLNGELNKFAEELNKKLVDILSDIEVSLDYPEEDIEFITKEKTKAALEESIAALDSQLKTRETGKMIKDGVRVAIVGKPNVGKSSLLNALLKEEKAIVTSVAGTTRDIVEGTLTINGLKFNLFDTAGIRQTGDEVEKIGVDRAKGLISSADIVVFVKDKATDDGDDSELNKLLNDKQVIYVINKADQRGDYSISGNVLNVSALNKKNIDALLSALYELAVKNKTLGSGLVLTSERHYSALLKTKEHLLNALSALNNLSIDVITFDINLARQSLGEITGNTSSDEVLDAIFSKFCLGK